MSIKLYINSIYKHLKLLNKFRDTDAVKPLLKKIKSTTKQLYRKKQSGGGLPSLSENTLANSTVGEVLKSQKKNDQILELSKTIPEEHKKVFIKLFNDSDLILSEMKKLKKENGEYKQKINQLLNLLQKNTPKIQQVNSKINDIYKLLSSKEN